MKIFLFNFDKRSIKYLIPIVAIVFYFQGSLYFMKNVETGSSIVDKEMRTIFKLYSNTEIVDRDEKRLLAYPQDIHLRQTLISFYSLKISEVSYKEKAQQHVIWVMKNVPFHEGNWFLWSTIFMPNEHNKFSHEINEWKELIIKSGNLKYLRNAATFFQLIDQDFSIQSWRKVMQNDDLDIGAKYELANLLSYKSDHNELKESFKLYSEYLVTKWDDQDYQKLLMLKARVGDLLYPKIVSKYLLFLRSCECPKDDDYYLLTKIANVGLNAKEYEKVRPLIYKAKEIEEKEEMRADYKPKLQQSYVVLARWYLFKNDLKNLALYLNKLRAISSIEDSYFIITEKSLINELIESGNSTIAEQYLHDKILGFPRNKRKEVINIVKKYVTIKLNFSSSEI